MTLKEMYKDIPAVGYVGLSNWGGLEVLDVLYGIDDYLVTCFNYGDGRTRISRNKIYTAASGRCYIRKSGRRFYLDEIMRVANSDIAYGGFNPTDKSLNAYAKDKNYQEPIELFLKLAEG